MNGVNNSTYPLAGRRVVVTRAESQAARLVSLLTDERAIVVRLPLIEVVINEAHLGALRESASMVGASDWTVFTSANAVNACVEADVVDQIRKGQVAAIGAATSRALGAAGLTIDFVPTQATAAAMSVELPAVGTVFLPLAELADRTLTIGLEARGIASDRVTAYKTRTPTHDPALLADAASADVMMVTSPSVVDRLVDLLGVGSIVEPLVCIGPTTGAAASRHGLATVRAESPDDQGLVLAARQCVVERR